MTNQEILDNAPKGATHIDNKGTSLFRDKKDGIRSLADIKRIAELEKERIKLLSCLLDISDECIGEITMNYRVDAEYIGRKIYAATGMTNPQLTEALKKGK